MDRLTVINGALIATGNHPVAAEFDGSPEWVVAYSAFERAMPMALARHDWGFATVSAALTRTGTPSIPGWEDEFQRPTAALHLTGVRSAEGYQIAWLPHGDKILTSSGGAATAEYVRASAVEGWHPVFTEVMTLFVEAGCYRGLNEDPAEANVRERKAEMMLAEARSRSDQEAPSRVMFVSRLRQARHRPRY
jgi:hypothetical protein